MSGSLNTAPVKSEEDRLRARVALLEAMLWETLSMLEHIDTELEPYIRNGRATLNPSKVKP